MERNLISAYRWHRLARKSAHMALAHARQDVANGKDRYPAIHGDVNRESGGLRWVENPERNGLRFVGWCDEIACRNYRYAGGINHKGWFTDEADCGETMRGAVYQLPARKGKPVYISGYVASHETPESGARLDFSQPTFGEAGNDDEPAKREAAHWADSIAEREAEKEREYQAALRAGTDAAEAEAAAKEARAEQLAFLKALRPKKAAFCDSPALIDAAREKVESLLQSIAGFRAERDRLKADCPSWLREAFADGYGEAV